MRHLFEPDIAHRSNRATASTGKSIKSIEGWNGLGSRFAEHDLARLNPSDQAAWGQS